MEKQVVENLLAQAIGNRAIKKDLQFIISEATLLEEIKLSRIDGSYTNLVKDLQDINF